MDAADNAIKEDELEPTIDDDDDKIGLNFFKVEDLDDHGRNRQAYLAEKEGLEQAQECNFEDIG
jgi:hypothetical protein